MYFDTDLGIMLVWNGSSWVPLAQGAAAATTASLYYHATAGQTVFPLSVADRYGHTFAFNQTKHRGPARPRQWRAPGAHCRLHRRHRRLVVTFLRPLVADAIVLSILLTPVAQLTPAGTVNTVLLSPIAPDGVENRFTAYVASNGNRPTSPRTRSCWSRQRRAAGPGEAYNASAARDHLRRSAGSRRADLHRLVRASRRMTKAFDLALFVPAPTNLWRRRRCRRSRAAVHHQIRAFGHRLRPRHCRRRLDAEGDAQNQILISGPGPDYAWALGTNPAAAASVPPATALHQMLMADASLHWQDTTIAVVMALGNAVTTTVGGVFSTSAKLDFHSDLDPDRLHRRRRPDAFDPRQFWLGRRHFLSPRRQRTKGG